MKNIVIVKSNFYIYLTVLLLIIPLQWLVSWIVAIVFHELCHYITVKVCKGTIESVGISFGGVEMRCADLSNLCRFIAILSGPFGGFLLICLGRWFPCLALCSFFLSLYNLLPILPLDGGQALQIVLKSKKIFDVLQGITLLLLMIFAIFCTFYLRLGALPLAVVIGIIIKHRKRPCKESLCRVQ